MLRRNRVDVAGVESPSSPGSAPGTATHDPEWPGVLGTRQKSTGATPDRDPGVPPSYLDHWVYVARDKAGKTLYVGITYTGITRLKEHRLGDAEWPRLVADFEIEHFDTREEAHAREIELIRKLAPLYNIHHRDEIPINRRMLKWWPSLIPVEEVAEYISFDVETVKRAVRRGDLPGAITIKGRRYITTQEAARAWIDRGSNIPARAQVAELYFEGRM